METERRAKRYFVSGVVQGVGYRYFAQRAAQRLGLVGYARNLRDGRVEVYAIGTDETLSSFRAELQRGPQMAFVSLVTDEDAPMDVQFGHGFSIEHGTW